MRALISIRKIANGYLVSVGDPYQTSVVDGGNAEVFYPSKEGLLADAQDLLGTAMTAAEATQDRLAQEINQKRHWLNQSVQSQMPGAQADQACVNR
jgi:hypothetical protein